MPAASCHPPRCQNPHAPRHDSSIQMLTKEGISLSSLPTRSRCVRGRHSAVYAFFPRLSLALQVGRAALLRFSAHSHGTFGYMTHLDPILKPSWVWKLAPQPRASYIAVACEDGSLQMLQVVFSTVHGLYGDRCVFCQCGRGVGDRLRLCCIGCAR